MNTRSRISLQDQKVVTVNIFRYSRLKILPSYFSSKKGKSSKAVAPPTPSDSDSDVSTRLTYFINLYMNW